VPGLGPGDRGSSGNAKLMPKGRSSSESAPLLKLYAFDQSSALATTYYIFLPALPALEEVMENFAELMQRLLEVQSGGRQRSPELIAEDERLIEGLRSLAGKSAQTVKLGQDSP
jgi:hypothetical protein